MPDNAILLETEAGNTGQNITLSRQVLRTAGVEVDSVLLIPKPYMERRSYATCRRLWPEVEVVCASEPLEFGDYVKSIGDDTLVCRGALPYPVLERADGLGPEVLMHGSAVDPSR